MRTVLKIVNFILTRLFLLLLLVLFGVSAYSVWDNYQVYTKAENVVSELYLLKPEVDEETDEVSFEALKEINPDICGWITVPGTHIDYPIVQGRDNTQYLNTDIYGEYSLAGSIYLDSRSASQFTSPYSLIYGHHMDRGLMFGDLDKFQNAPFFEDHRTVIITTEWGTVEYNVYASMKVPDSVREIFDPTAWGNDLRPVIQYIQENATVIWNPALDEIEEGGGVIKIVVLVTCASGHTGERTILVLIRSSDPEVEPTTVPTTKPSSNVPSPPPAKTGDTIWNSPALWAGLLCVAAVVLLVLHAADRRHREEEAPSE